jgi:hypothetical protein
MDEDHRPKPPPETSGSREIAAGGNSVRALVSSLLTSANNIVTASDASFIQSQPHGGFFCQTLLKIKKNAKKKAVRRRESQCESWNVADIVQKHFKCSRNNTPAVQNADHEGASSNQNIEVGDRHLDLSLV